MLSRYTTPLIATIAKFNFFITTDFATSAKQTADYSVISVWAYNSNGDWFWVDGICVRQTMDKSIDDLFRLVQMYKPQQTGIEITGQQGATDAEIQAEIDKVKEGTERNFISEYEMAGQNIVD